MGAVEDTAVCWRESESAPHLSCFTRPSARRSQGRFLCCFAPADTRLQTVHHLTPENFTVQGLYKPKNHLIMFGFIKRRKKKVKKGFRKPQKTTATRNGVNAFTEEVEAVY